MIHTVMSVNALNTFPILEFSLLRQFIHHKCPECPLWQAKLRYICSQSTHVLYSVSRRITPWLPWILMMIIMASNNSVVNYHQVAMTTSID